MNNFFKALEIKLLNPAVRNSADELNKIIADDFLERGSSGKDYNKQQAITALENEEPKDIAIMNFNSIELSEGIVLVTYISEQKNENCIRKCLRSSIWKNNDEIWQIVFHQGTILKK